MARLLFWPSSTGRSKPFFDLFSGSNGIRGTEDGVMLWGPRPPEKKKRRTKKGRPAGRHLLLARPGR
eukprot:10275361-Alexandrium_andersonii.AAC.1